MMADVSAPSGSSAAGAQPVSASALADSSASAAKPMRDVFTFPPVQVEFHGGSPLGGHVCFRTLNGGPPFGPQNWTNSYRAAIKSPQRCGERRNIARERPT